MGNFQREYITTIYGMEGYYDDYTYEDWKDDTKVLEKIAGRRRDQLEKTSGNKYIYQFMMTPNAGFLNNNKVKTLCYYISNHFSAFTTKYRAFNII